jgi:hypothetical protein
MFKVSPALKAVADRMVAEDDPLPEDSSPTWEGHLGPEPPPADHHEFESEDLAPAPERDADNGLDDDFLAFWHGEVAVADSRPWLVQDTIPEVGAGLLSGQWGTYKTFTAIDLGAAIISRGQIFGSAVVRQGGVLLYAAEGESEVPIRLQAGLAKRCPDLIKAPFTWLTPDKVALNLLDPKSVAEFIERARRIDAEMRRRFNLPLALIEIDTVVATAGYAKPGDENDSVLGVRLMKTGWARSPGRPAHSPSVSIISARVRKLARAVPLRRRTIAMSSWLHSARNPWPASSPIHD